MSMSDAARTTTTRTRTPPKRTFSDVELDLDQLAESFDVPPSTSSSASSAMAIASSSASASSSSTFASPCPPHPATILITDSPASRSKATLLLTSKQKPKHPHPRTSMQHPSSSAPIKVGVLGATGTVGQRFLTLLAAHPWFAVDALGASPRSAGKKYKDAVSWKQSTPIPQGVRDVVVRECRPENFAQCKIVFSGLDADVAGEIEEAFRAANLAVFSNAKNFRRDPHVPLIVPLVNPHHLSIIPQQQALFSPALTSGFIVTNANCSTTGYVIPLAAMEKAFGPLECVMVTTLQAISGAGYPGVPSLDILDNVIPYISGEEEKIEWETLKILGGISTKESEVTSADGQQVVKKEVKTFDMHAAHPLRVSASCNRVPVIDGHTECVSVRFARRPPPSPQQVREALAAYTPEAQALGCPSAPCRAIVVHEEPDRPQPRLDRYYQDGAGVSVGRVRQCQVLDVKFVVLANNVSIGAATSSIINAEYAVLKNVVQL
ncbi:putative aspartate-semialdehyde dehydrogenase [Psilocybe cubensis]|uniref:Aspartate-semialdehyde dehydrogenase n=2 Tax=Psilocybe cubensis TaxID=181762 RepID=A0ACB8H2T9_PSICU|nr:putative aspartate-semialdehyde dehydrogenase [Psilocybe cubensis]KAH9482181.1 putative aspartate-semialdehyde dehydrogenase [Psilocybe cubensis]